MKQFIRTVVLILGIVFILLVSFFFWAKRPNLTESEHNTLYQAKD